MRASPVFQFRRRGLLNSGAPGYTDDRMDDAIDRITERLGWALCGLLALAWGLVCALWHGLKDFARWLFSTLPGPAQQRLALLGIDLASHALALYAWAGKGAAALLAVKWDPLAASRAVIPLKGSPYYTGFVVETAASERERRIAAWFYRWHEVPSDDDWRRCLARFGLAAVPSDFTLRLHGAAGALSERITVRGLTLGATGSRGFRTLVYALDGAGETPGDVKTVSGATPLGGLSPLQFLKDLGLNKKHS